MTPDDWLADRTLAESELRHEGVVLGITRRDGRYLGARRATACCGQATCSSSTAAPRQRLNDMAPACHTPGMDVRFISSFSIITGRPDADRRLFAGALDLPLHPPEGAEADGTGYLFTDTVEGAKHFGLWPLGEAAEACFGTTDWPETHPVPQASIEFEVDDVAAAAEELERAGYVLLHPARTEPWGQEVARLQTADGVIVGVSFTPWMRPAD